MIRDRHIRYTVRPADPTDVLIEVSPYAVCVLRERSAARQEDGVRLYADNQGRVRFSFESMRVAGTIGQFELTVLSDGEAVEEIVLELRAGLEPTAAYAAPPPFAPEAGDVVEVLPPLSESERFGRSNEWLIEHGYPMRWSDDPVSDDGRHWAMIVSRPVTVLQAPIDRVREDRRAPAITSWTPTNNWSGIIAGRYPNTFDSVTATWRVPSVRGDRGLPGIETGSSVWVGIGGFDGVFPLVQTGTEHDATAFVSGNVSPAPYGWWVAMDTVSSSSAQHLWGPPISAGDQVRAEAWIGPASGPDLASLSATFRIWNLTTSATVPAMAVPLNVASDGSDAEWILERPLGGNGQLVPLADFDKVAMQCANAGLVAGGSLHCTGSIAFPSFPLEILGSSGRTLANPTFEFGSDVDIAWHGFE